MNTLSTVFLSVTTGCLVLFSLLALVRTLIGPTKADRIVGINLIGTFSTTLLAILSVLFFEDWLLDVCLIYCMLSFLAVVVLSKIHIEEKGDDND